MTRECADDQEDYSTSVAALFFAFLALFAIVMMLNLLIAIVSDEFEQFMERADLEAQLAVAGICEEARQVLQVQPLIYSDPSIMLLN